MLLCGEQHAAHLACDTFAAGSLGNVLRCSACLRYAVGDRNCQPNLLEKNHVRHVVANMCALFGA